METKLIAAEIATAAGVMTVVTSSKDPQNIFKIIEYNSAFKSGTNTPLSGLHSGRASPEPHPVAPSITPTPSTPGEPSVTPTPSSSLPSSSTRPPHTIFLPSALPLRDLKAWTSHTLHPSGSVIIDSGAHHVLSKRESGGRLLAAGVLGVRGAFASGQAVRILIRTGPSGEATEAVAGSEKTEGGSSYADGTAVTEPNTPEINATASLSSSISTLDQLSIVDEEMTPSTTLRPLPEDDTVLIERAADSTADWELEEVGRGLANYNSAQIERVKGLRRYVCHWTTVTSR